MRKIILSRRISQKFRIPGKLVIKLVDGPDNLEIIFTPNSARPFFCTLLRLNLYQLARKFTVENTQVFLEPKPEREIIRLITEALV